jgi:hypothetical protein
MDVAPEQTWSRPWHRKTTVIAALSVAAILAHLVLRFGFHATPSTPLNDHQNPNRRQESVPAEDRRGEQDGQSEKQVPGEDVECIGVLRKNSIPD